jgi:hypothetical protein
MHGSEGLGVHSSNLNIDNFSLKKIVKEQRKSIIGTFTHSDLIKQFSRQLGPKSFDG